MKDFIKRFVEIKDTISMAFPWSDNLILITLSKKEINIVQQELIFNENTEERLMAQVSFRRKDAWPVAE